MLNIVNDADAGCDQAATACIIQKQVQIVDGGLGLLTVPHKRCCQRVCVGSGQVKIVMVDFVGGCGVGD